MTAGLHPQRAKIARRAVETGATLRQIALRIEELGINKTRLLWEIEGLKLNKYSVGAGDRFAHQAKAQLQACVKALEQRS